MFQYKLPCGDFNTNTVINKEGKIRFDPPVYEQRYWATIQILEDEKWAAQMKKICDFGCAEIKFLRLLKRVKSAEHILEVDIDEELLRRHQQCAIPLISDYLQKRTKPLRVDILRGSMVDAVEDLCNVDAVIALEVLEHLHADVLSKVPKNVFGFIQPKLAIFSTPNSEFNVLFNMLDNGFRHEDHKFEWTRAEFKAWCLDICTNYPNYSVSLMGVGEAPANNKHLGFVSQIAIFVRNDLIDKPMVKANKPPIETDPSLQYKKIHSVEFPFYEDTRTFEEKLWSEILYQLNVCRRGDKYYNERLSIYQIPLSEILNYTVTLGASTDLVRTLLLENLIKINPNDDLILSADESSSDDYNDDEEQDADLSDDVQIMPEEEEEKFEEKIEEEEKENWQ